MYSIDNLLLSPTVKNRLTVDEVIAKSSTRRFLNKEVLQG